MINLALSKEHYTNENNFQWLRLVESNKLVSQCNLKQALPYGIVTKKPS